MYTAAAVQYVYCSEFMKRPVTELPDIETVRLCLVIPILQLHVLGLGVWTSMCMQRTTWRDGGVAS